MVVFARSLRRGITSAWQRTVSGSSSYVDKAKLLQEIRHNDRKCQALFKTGRFIVFHDGKPLVHCPNGTIGTQQLFTTTYEDLTLQSGLPPTIVSSSSVFLDLQDGTVDNGDLLPCFALGIPGEYSRVADELCQRTDASFYSPRIAVFLLPHAEAKLVSQASSQLNWAENFKFCPRCGHQIQRNVAGTLKKCYCCQQVHYPQLSPVAITLVVNGKRDECLLVRQPHFVNGMFTAIAGFIETGETLEEAVRREVAEEVGLQVQNVQYLLSQHWSFPGSTLMLACVADADRTQPILLDNKELEAARWFSVAEVRDATANAEKNPFLRVKNKDNVVFIPPRGAVAHDLIKYFLRNLGF